MDHIKKIWNQKPEETQWLSEMFVKVLIPLWPICPEATLDSKALSNQDTLSGPQVEVFCPQCPPGSQVVEETQPRASLVQGNATPATLSPCP